MFKSAKPDPEIERVREEVIRTIQIEFPSVTPEQIVAVLSYTVGQAISMCDQRKYTSDMLMELVSQNLEAGNRDAIAQTLGTTRGNA